MDKKNGNGKRAIKDLPVSDAATRTVKAGSFLSSIGKAITAPITLPLQIAK